MTMERPANNYERLGSYVEPIDMLPPDITSVDYEETPHESGVMIHVVESNRARWNHVEDLDSFFSRMYRYHQKHGFVCMMLQETFELGQFIFVVLFSTYLFHCVDYPVLFKDRVDNSTLRDKVSLGDAMIPPAKCIVNLGLFTWFCILIAALVWVLRTIKVFYHVFQFWDIKMFYNTALKIDDAELDNLTWHEVQVRVREVQLEQQMCIHKRDLSELDIYHRILRFHNYLVAMVNKNLLPVKLNILGQEIVFLTRGLKYNLELLLFWGPWSPFENNWHLKEDFKKTANRHELAARLSRNILWIGITNFILCPLIMLWQIMYSFFSYAEMVKREPGSLGSRCWSLYGRLYLRHFNELEHELHARLNRAYRPASKYMNSFSSPLMTVIAKNVGFLTGAILAVLLILTIYDEDVITVEHVLTLITVLGAVVAGCRAFIPDENLVRCPETLLTAVLAHVHYLPDAWRGVAHTQRVRYEFSQLFQYRAVYLLEELLSPIITPYILCCKVRPRALDIVDFYRNFTVAVVGVGDVCSFAQMDVRRHGHPDWQAGSAESGGDSRETTAKLPTPIANQYTQAEDGKTELSLIHFTLTNPTWKMPSEAQNFVKTLKRNAQRDLDRNYTDGTNPMYQTIHSVSSLGAGYQSLMQSIFQNAMLHQSMSGGQVPHLFETHNVRDTELQYPTMLPLDIQENIGRQSIHMAVGSATNQSSIIRGGLHRAEGPMFNNRGLLYSLSNNQQSMGASVFGVQSPTPLHSDQDTPNIEMTAADMSLSTLYLHELHHRQVRRRGVLRDQTQRSLWQRPHQQSDAPPPMSSASVHNLPSVDSLSSAPMSSRKAAENTPLLKKNEKR